ncbi:MAG TPA: serine/threonine-protein kinase [Kofleriaceae bacterium]
MELDCDDAMLLLARATELTDAERVALDDHVADCDACLALVRATPLASRLSERDPDRFELGETIATGGMGRIVRAFDPELGREVAIKEMLGPEHRERFEREALITARLQHPAIVPIYEAGTRPDGTAYYAMRLVPGETLFDAIARRKTLAERLALLPHVVAVADALAYAHAQGVIHRDLKPHNVLIGDFGETVVIDWGLAKRHGDDESSTGSDAAAVPTLTMAGTVVGTPCFLSPEQARGDALDERTDVFAIGAILYNLVVGEPPYWDRTHDSAELVAEALERAPTAVSLRAPDAPADLRTIIDRATARPVEERFRDAGELAAELRRFEAGQLLLSREYGLGDLLGRWIRRHRALVATASIAVLGLGVVGVIAVRNELRARAAERDGATAFRRGQRALCEASGPTFESPWTPAQEEVVHHRITAVAMPIANEIAGRIEQRFDDWTKDLAAARETVCDASATTARPQLAAELDCLGDRTREVRAMIEQLVDVDSATLLTAANAVDTLTPISRCTTELPPRSLSPNTPQTAAVRDNFSTIRALLKLGKARVALPLAEKAVVDADAIGDLRLRGAARVALGACQSNVSKYDDALVTMRAALRLSETAQDDRSVAQAWVNLVQIEYRRGKPENAIAILDAALGATARISDVALQTEVMLTAGGAYTQLGKFAAAEQLFVDAVKMRKDAWGDRDARVAAAQGALGNAYAMRGAIEKGIAAHEAAASVTKTSLGASHPTYGVALGNLGSDYLFALRPAEAVNAFEEARQIAEAAYGAKHRDVASALTNLGTAHLEAGDPQSALTDFAAAEAGWNEINPEHPSMAEVLLGRYLATRALGNPGNVADLERALPLSAQLPPFIRGRVELYLGMALTGPRAKELVASSSKDFMTTTLPLIQREQKVAATWLAEHP